jgi:hypothetical protein
MKRNGTDWKSVGNKGFSDGSTKFNSLVVDNGTPYVAYVEGNQMMNYGDIAVNGEISGDMTSFSTGTELSGGFGSLSAQTN